MKVKTPKIKLNFKTRILNLWQGKNRDRLLLFGLIAAVWLIIKAVEELVPERYLDKLPSNVSLTLASVIALIMIVHAAYIFVAQYHRRRNPRLKIDSNYKPSIDIFISAHNEKEVIADTMEHVLKLDYPNFHLFVINDRSKDNTLEIMKGFEQKHSNKLTIIDRPQTAFPGKAAALNDAFKVSGGEVILVMDADARLGDAFFDNILPYLDDPLVAAAQAQKVIMTPHGDSKMSFLVRNQCYEYAMDTYLQMGRDSIRGSVELRGNGQLVKRKALDDVGGWNEDTLTDDLDLSTSLHVHGWDIRFSSEAKVFEEGVPTLDGFIKQRRRWAEGSMRRYLNYFLQLFKPGNLTLNQIFDTFTFLSEFSIPLWLSLDIVFEAIRYFNDRETYITYFMLISMSIALVTWFAQFNGLRIYKKQGFFTAFANAVIGNFYLYFTWVIVILISYRKILFSRTVGTWTRTQHGVN